MTALGKMLVIFNFILACFMTFCVVLLWVEVKNWKAEAKRVELVAVDNYKGAEDARKRYDEERERMNAAILQARAEADKYRAEREEYARENKLIKEDYDKKLSLERKSEAQNEVSQQTIKSLQTQNSLLSRDLKAAETEVTDLNIQLKVARVQRDEFERERKAYADQVERLKDQLKDLSDRYVDAMQGSKTLQGSPIAPENFRGTVRAYKDDFVEITPGLNAGLKPGTRLMIRRVMPGGDGKFVGYLVIGETVNPERAVGRWEKPVNLKAVTLNDLPKAGDEVVPIK